MKVFYDVGNRYYYISRENVVEHQSIRYTPNSERIYEKWQEEYRSHLRDKFDAFKPQKPSSNVSAYIFWYIFSAITLFAVGAALYFGWAIFVCVTIMFCTLCYLYDDTLTSDKKISTKEQMKKYFISMSVWGVLVLFLMVGMFPYQFFENSFDFTETLIDVDGASFILFLILSCLAILTCFKIESEESVR